jgi:hypothetical protein
MNAVFKSATGGREVERPWGTNRVRSGSFTGIIRSPKTICSSIKTSAKQEQGTREQESGTRTQDSGRRIKDQRKRFKGKNRNVERGTRFKDN